MTNCWSCFVRHKTQTSEKKKRIPQLVLAINAGFILTFMDVLTHTKWGGASPHYRYEDWLLTRLLRSWTWFHDETTGSSVVQAAGYKNIGNICWPSLSLPRLSPLKKLTGVWRTDVCARIPGFFREVCCLEMFPRLMLLMLQLATSCPTESPVIIRAH